MTLEPDPVIIAVILTPAIICIGVMLLYMVKYWKDKRKNEKETIEWKGGDLFFKEEGE